MPKQEKSRFQKRKEEMRKLRRERRRKHKEESTGEKIAEFLLSPKGKKKFEENDKMLGELAEKRKRESKLTWEDKNRIYKEQTE